MSLITPELWSYYLPDVKMPANCTYRQFAAARDNLWAEDKITDIAKRIAKLKGIAEKSEPAKREIINQMITEEIKGIA